MRGVVSVLDDDLIQEDLEGELFNPDDLLAAKAVRKCIKANDGFFIVGADADQVEMRIIGALAGEDSMIEAAHKGESQHELTCRMMYGPIPEGFNGWKPADPKRYKLAKVAGFCAVYGGGAKAIAEQADVPMEDAQRTARLYKESLPALADYKREVTEHVLDQAFTKRQKRVYLDLRKELWGADELEKTKLEKELKRLTWGKVGSVVTPFRRRLFVDADRAYSGVNYIVQSTARDVLAHGLLRLASSPVAHTLLMVVHDEALGEAREEEAEETARIYGECLTTSFMGVPLDASGEVYGRSWGDKKEYQ